MSAEQREVIRALYSLLSADATLTSLGVTGVYRNLAPQTATFPYIIVTLLDSRDRYTLGLRALTDQVWSVKAVDKSESSATADAISGRIDDLLTDGVLVVDTLTHMSTRRTAEFQYPEITDGVVYQHSGGNYKLEVTRT